MTKRRKPSVATYHWRVPVSDERYRRRAHLIKLNRDPISERLCQPGRIVNCAMLELPPSKTIRCGNCLGISEQHKVRIVK